MQKLLICLALTFAFTFVFCEETQEPSVCQRAFDFRMDVAKDLCQGYVECMPCECLDGGMTFDASDCVDPPSVTCEATDLEHAETCLTDETACASEMAATIETICGTPLEE